MYSALWTFLQPWPAGLAHQVLLLRAREDGGGGGLQTHGALQLLLLLLDLGHEELEEGQLGGRGWGTSNQLHLPSLGLKQLFPNILHLGFQSIAFHLVLLGFDI